MNKLFLFLYLLSNRHGDFDQNPESNLPQYHEKRSSFSREKKGMNGKLLFFSLLLLLTHPIHSFAIASELEENYRYFGVNAIVHQAGESDYYEVQTNGDSEKEGFVFTINHPGTGDNFQLTLQLKGDSSVILLIEETNRKGKYLKEFQSPSIQLTDDWKQYTQELALDENTKQMDVMVLTSQKQKSNFSFRNISVTID
ncbi:hypothetical protein OEV98_08130 [Caldibacillus lycopersici]|uniref:Uncharacterized protein n=1 Tax=Perspicuibacillus lycopersici TaxID=1325689 RepID=A0AAE3LQI1_9BACI|nr:hypothetical protein [Perspicuibacillus lycopersici]MCU9613524.1 hypothetical protein [Perspicuibacillus lycopersici]